MPIYDPVPDWKMAEIKEHFPSEREGQFICHSMLSWCLHSSLQLRVLVQRVHNQTFSGLFYITWTTLSLYFMEHVSIRRTLDLWRIPSTCQHYKNISMNPKCFYQVAMCTHTSQTFGKSLPLPLINIFF